MAKPLSCQHSLELIDAPAVEPITLAEAKAQMRVEHTDDDTIIERLIDVAISYTDVTGALGKAMITQKWGQWVAPNPTDVTLILGPVQAVTAVKYYDLDGVLQDDDYNNYDAFGTATATVIKPKTGFNWPTSQQRSDSIKIEYEIGYGDTAADVPAVVKHALLMLVSYLYENRETAQMDALQEVPYGYHAMLNMERSCWYG
jgi:phage conserved hypothetical protein, phiE125 gp8 family